MTLSNQLQVTAPRALTIAGFDPSGGAGVLADARTFAAFGLQTSAVITSLTLQNPERVFGALHQTAEAVRGQVEPLIKSQRFACAKTGMLPTREVVIEVARLFRETDLPRPVVDPVIISSSGQRLMDADALAVLLEELMPLARLVTPNIPEAETLSGVTINSEADMRRAAAILRERGARAVLIKGGHLKKQESGVRSQESGGGKQKAGGGKQKAGGRRQKAGREQANERDAPDDDGTDDDGADEFAIDVLDDEGEVTVFREKRVPGAELHGSGCLLSAAIAAGLGKGMILKDAVKEAKSFVLEAIRSTAALAW